MPRILKVDQVVNSALWAAYGDALGFISEGVDERGLSRRLRERELDTVEWVRKVSRQSPDIRLPAGMYSDDTQLRLATSRAIGADGSFDVDTFSYIELPAWLDYHLGAGLGSLASARRLRSGTAWNKLVSGDRDGRYVNGGGNGAAMRIQPHVWAPSSSIDVLAIDIIHNTACTHGHPKAFVGSLFHGLMLRAALESRRLPDDRVAAECLEIARQMRALILDSPHLGSAWVQSWERSTASILDKEWDAACDEIKHALNSIPSQENPIGNRALYREYLQQIGLLGPERGVATRTAVAAYAAIRLYSTLPSRTILANICSITESDTDTIATMAGALLGAHREEECTSVIMDREYIVAEATRLANITQGSTAISHSLTRPKLRYEDLLSKARRMSDIMGKASAKEFYQWARLPFGQTVLLRVPPSKIRQSSLDPDLFSSVSTTAAPKRPNRIVKEAAVEPSRDPVEIARTLAGSGFDPKRIGRYLLNCARYPHGEGLASAIAYEVVRLFREERITERSASEEQARALTSQVPNPKPIAEFNGAVSQVARRLYAALQLQLRADPEADGWYRLDGTLSNYGHETAKNVVVTIGPNGNSSNIEIDSLPVEKWHAIEQVNAGSITDGTPVAVDFSSGGIALRQTGRFERAVGSDSVLLLKGLDLARPAFPPGAESAISAAREPD